MPDPADFHHLIEQAKNLLKQGEAQFLEEAGQLKQVIDQGNFDRAKELMLKTPALHRAPIGYAKDGPLTWVAECRIPPAAPSPARLEFARWMIENGSDVHQGGDGPLMRAALDGDRVPIMELLVNCGADVNAAWHGNYPIIFAACEALDPISLRWLLAHGADPNCGTVSPSALDYLLGAYARDAEVLSACIDMLRDAGGKSRYDVPAMLAILRGRLDDLTELLNGDPGLIFQRFAELDFGTTAGRMLTLRGTTLLHVAAEFGNIEAVKLLLDRGADVNAAALIDDTGVGGQTAVYHAATQGADRGFPIVQLLVEQGADLSLRVKVPGHYEKRGEVLECTPLKYSMLFPGTHGVTVEFLKQQAAPE